MTAQFLLHVPMLIAHSVWISSEQEIIFYLCFHWNFQFSSAWSVKALILHCWDWRRVVQPDFHYACLFRGSCQVDVNVQWTRHILWSLLSCGMFALVCSTDSLNMLSSLNALFGIHLSIKFTDEGERSSSERKAWNSLKLNISVAGCGRENRLHLLTSVLAFLSCTFSFDLWIHFQWKLRRTRGEVSIKYTLVFVHCLRKIRLEYSIKQSRRDN